MKPDSRNYGCSPGCLRGSRRYRHHAHLIKEISVRRTINIRWSLGTKSLTSRSRGLLRKEHGLENGRRGACRWRKRYKADAIRASDKRRYPFVGKQDKQRLMYWHGFLARGTVCCRIVSGATGSNQPVMVFRTATLRAKGTFTFSGQQPVLDFYHLATKWNRIWKPAKEWKIRNSEEWWSNLCQHGISFREINILRYGTTTGECNNYSSKVGRERNRRLFANTTSFHRKGNKMRDKTVY